MSLCVVRHAPVLAPAGLCYGRLDLPADPALTALAARDLAQALPARVALRTSPAQRCRDLAMQLAALRGDLQPTVDERLQEMDFGRWEGQAWDAIDRAAIDAWTADFATLAPGGGEAVATFMARVAQAWDATHAAAAPQVWITHAGVVRAALLLARGVRHVHAAADWPSDAVPHGHPLWLSARAGAVRG